MSNNQNQGASAADDNKYDCPGDVRFGDSTPLPAMNQGASIEAEREMMQTIRHRLDQGLDNYPLNYEQSLFLQDLLLRLEQADRRTPAATTGELPSVKTWQDRYFVDGTGPGDQDMMMRCMEDEIADLRAHLAAPASAQPASNAADPSWYEGIEIVPSKEDHSAAGAQPDQRESAADGSLAWGNCQLYRGSASPSPAAQPAKDEQMTLYTCVGKGGFYRLLGTATGAGTSRGLEDVRVYMEADNPLALYYRTIIDFDARMQEAQVQDCANNGADKQKGGA